MAACEQLDVVYHKRMGAEVAASTPVALATNSDAVGNGVANRRPACMSVETPNPCLGQGDNPQNLDKFVWGAGAIGEEINRTERQTHHLLSTGQIKCAQKKGGRWVASRTALRAEFGG
jgi:hypothetical protein